MRKSCEAEDMLVAPPSVDWTSHRGGPPCLSDSLMANVAKDAGFALSKGAHLRDGLQPPSTDLPMLSSGLNGDLMHHLRSHQQQLRINLPLGTVIQPSLVPIGMAAHGAAGQGSAPSHRTSTGHGAMVFATPANRAGSYKLPQKDAVSLAQSVRERRRMNRVAEQRRRDALKSSLKDLRSLIPGAIDAAVDKDATVNGQGQTKSAIIRQTIEYILYLHEKHQGVKRQRDELERTNDTLRKCIEEAAHGDDSSMSMDTVWDEERDMQDAGDLENASASATLCLE